MDEKKVLDLLKELKQDHIISQYSSESKEAQQKFIIQFNELDKVCRG